MHDHLFKEWDLKYAHVLLPCSNSYAWNRGQKAVLHDRPPAHFRRTTPPEIHEVSQIPGCYHFLESYPALALPPPQEIYLLPHAYTFLSLLLTSIFYPIHHNDNNEFRLRQRRIRPNPFYVGKSFIAFAFLF